MINRLERNEEALIDANKALQNNERNVKSIAAKGEALFSSGKFEQALVQFEKGIRIHKDSDMTDGLMKCRQAILSSLGEDGIVFDKEMVSITIRGIQLDMERKEKKEKEKANDWKTGIQKKNKEKAESRPKPPRRDPILKFSNLLREEELFLQRLKSLENLNFGKDVKRDSRWSKNSQVRLFCHIKGVQ